MITLSTLSQATAQQVFDQVVQNLIRQGKASINDGGTCCYRTTQEDGTQLKCAAGWLIGDDEYTDEMDTITGTDWGNLVDRGMVPEAHRDLISELQYIHDAVQVLDWERAFQKYAYTNGLEYNSIHSKTYEYVQDEGVIYSDAE